MTQATGDFQVYPNAKLLIANGTVDFLTDTVKVILLNGSHAYNSAHTDLSEVSANEISTGSGYTQQTLALASKTITLASGIVKFDAADSVWTASGGSIIASAAVIYDDTVTDDKLLASIIFSQEVTVTDGNNFNLIYSPNGIFTL